MKGLESGGARKRLSLISFPHLSSFSVLLLPSQDSALKLKEAEEAQSTLQAECEQYRAILAETVSYSSSPRLGLRLGTQLHLPAAQILLMGLWWASHSMLGLPWTRLFAGETKGEKKYEFLEFFFSLIMLETFLVDMGCCLMRGGTSKGSTKQGG